MVLQCIPWEEDLDFDALDEEEEDEEGLDTDVEDREFVDFHDWTPKSSMFDTESEDDFQQDRADLQVINDKEVKKAREAEERAVCIAKMSGSGRMRTCDAASGFYENLYCMDSKRGPVFAIARGHLSCGISIRKPS